MGVIIVSACVDYPLEGTVKTTPNALHFLDGYVAGLPSRRPAAFAGLSWRFPNPPSLYQKTQSFTAMRCSSAVTLTASMIQNISCFSLVTFLVSVNNLILWPKAHSWSLRGWVRRSHFRCTCLPVQLRILHQLAPRAETSSSRSECFVTFVIAINYLLTRGLVAKWNENRKL